MQSLPHLTTRNAVSALPSATITKYEEGYGYTPESRAAIAKPTRVNQLITFIGGY